MSKDKSSGHKHDASDRALDKSATAEQNASGAGHDPAEIAKHDDLGKDRLFEGRQQHDEAEKNSEKTRLARDVDKHGHDMGEKGADNTDGLNPERIS